MLIRKGFVHLIVLTILAAAVAVAANSNWVKLGEKDVDFGRDHDSIDVADKGKIRELRFSIRNAPIKFQKVVINYKDGQRQELEFLEDVQVGTDSRSMTIEGDGHPIKSLDLWYKTDSLGGKKAKVTVFGKS